MRNNVKLTAAAVTALGLLLAGCGGSGDANTDQPNSSSTSPTSDSSQGPTVDVTIEGNSVTPNGKRVPVDLGQEVTINVTSDRAGELHVHSTPEQELEYDKGNTTLHLTLDKPGIVDVEDHVADVVVVQLEVS